MEAGIVKYISFKEYKEKILQNIENQKRNELISDRQIIDQGMKIMEAYENQQKKAGEQDGNI